MNSTRLGSFRANVAVFILRILSASFIFTHGLPKLIKVFQGDFSFGDPIGLGPMISLILSAFAEGICSVFLFVGYKTRLTAIPLVINMAVAAFFAHAGDPFSTKETSLLYLIMFIVIFISGGGRFSLDDKWSG